MVQDSFKKNKIKFMAMRRNSKIWRRTTWPLLVDSARGFARSCPIREFVTPRSHALGRKI
jgi:hypothetical protein